jgi:hypothetical protein
MDTERLQTGVKVTERIANEITTLAGKNKTQLLLLWKENFSQDPPNHLRKELMVSILAYRIQEKEYGGLSNNARNRLRDIARTLDSERSSRKRPPSSLKAGTRLVRSWQGVVHEVAVLDNGFEYRSQSYGNLSAIAREITGTRWSGPLFFGIRKKSA